LKLHYAPPTALLHQRGFFIPTTLTGGFFVKWNDYKLNKIIVKSLRNLKKGVYLHQK